MNAPKWIRFVEMASEPGRITRRWAVEPKDGSGRIGVVSWYGPWRCYGFEPEAYAVFEKQCLRDLADFCEARTQEHRTLRATAPHPGRTA